MPANVDTIARPPVELELDEPLLPVELELLVDPEMPELVELLELEEVVAPTVEVVPVVPEVLDPEELVEVVELAEVTPEVLDREVAVLAPLVVPTVEDVVLLEADEVLDALEPDVPEVTPVVVPAPI